MSITLPHSGNYAIYGVGPTAAPVEPDRFPFVSHFAADVGRAAAGPHYGITGGTYGLLNGRYVVGGYSTAHVLRLDISRSDAIAAALAFAETNRVALAQGFLLGFWRDLDTDRIWLDVSWAFGSQSEAVTAAQENGELFIYDRTEDRALDVRYA